jgi:D-alanyl-D-alanine carboxypeptidase
MLQRPLSAAVATLVLAAGCARAPVERDPQPPLPADLAEALQASLDRGLAALGGTGATLAVRVPGVGEQAFLAGHADQAGAPLSVDDGFRIGSITKTMHAAAAIQLVEAGRLALDVPVAVQSEAVGALLGEAFADVTPRQLLQHTAGIVDYTDRVGWFLDNLDVPWAHEDIVAACVADGPLFPPGTDERYSNTNFYVLGLLIEALEGAPLSDVLRELVFDPGGLDHTWLEGHGEARARLVPGYLAGNPALPLDPSWHWAAGGVVSTAPDLLRWVELLFDDGLLTTTARDALLRRGTLPDGRATEHGLAVRFGQTPCGPTRGHTGSTMGFQSDLFRLDGSGTDVVVLLDDFIFEASELAWAACEVVLDWQATD